MPLAQLNIATMRAPIDAPEMASFVALLAEVNGAAEEADGFIWRLQDDDGPGAVEQRIFGDDSLLVNMSVWVDLESLRAFVIGHDGHRAALQNRYDWFDRAGQPMTVCWPVAEGHLPTLDEAETMLLRLRTEGPSEDVFPFTYRG